MKTYKKELLNINNIISELINENIKSESLKEIINYALYGGKRLRSILAVIIGKAINNKINLDKLAISIELFHNSSLIIDDLPCMDNDLVRRGRPTLHAKYGQTKSQLIVSYLLATAYNLIKENLDEIREKEYYELEYLEKISIFILKNINNNLGFLGAAGGQFIDTCPINTFIDKKDYINNYKDLDNILTLIHLKTTTFFEISFVSSYLLAGGDLNNIDKVKKCVKYFGLAFQISDDFDDIEQDSKRVYDNKFNPNLICRYGKEKTLEIFNKAIAIFLKLSKELKIYNEIFDELIDFLKQRINKKTNTIKEKTDTIKEKTDT